MLITCTSCQTRFRVPDERIGPQGARVRCSRCQALFVVRRDDLPALSPPPLPPPLPGRPAPPPPPGTGAVEIELTRDPFAAARETPPPHDDPFAPRPPAPRASPETPAAFPPALALTAPFPPEPGVPDLFAARPAEGDPFAAPPLPGEASGGIALETAERRPPSRAPGLSAFDAAELAADFSTPGPSGLEVEAPFAPQSPQAPEPPPPPPEEPPAEPAAAAPRAPLPARQEPAERPAEPSIGPGRRAAAVLVNSLALALLLALAGALFVYWKGGGTSALWATAGLRRAESPFTARDVSSGLYDTACGKPVLFVRGQVAARVPSGRVRVRVELLDGDRTVARAEGLLGALPTPEEIWSSDPARAPLLRAALAARAAPRVAAGETLPFLVVLWEYPADLGGLDFRVVAEPAPG